MAAIAPLPLGRPSGNPPPPMGVAAGAPTQPQDPLYEALVRYITSGTDAAPVSSRQLEDVITNYSTANGGRAYLESIVSNQESEAMPALERWDHHAPATGFLSTTGTTFTMHLTVPEIAVSYDGNASGIFRPQTILINAQLYWNGDKPTGDVSFHAQSFLSLGILIVDFYNLLGEKYAQLHLTNVALTLPPSGVRGGGSFTSFA